MRKEGAAGPEEREAEWRLEWRLRKLLSVTTKLSPSRMASDVCSRKISRADEAEAEDREGRWAWARGWEARPAEGMGGTGNLGGRRGWGAVARAT